MKKVWRFLFLVCILLPLHAQNTNKLIVEESMVLYDTEIKLCRTKTAGYVLIITNTAIYQQSLVIYEDDNYQARNVYGEILLAYYSVKNANKRKAEYNGVTYEIQDKNIQGEKKFLLSLTDISVLEEYKSFSYIDENTSKSEKVTYQKEDGEKGEEEIGSSAGFLMQISATDFIEVLVRGKE